MIGNGRQLISGTDSASFTIDADTGVLSTTVAVDAAVKPLYSFDILANGTFTNVGKATLTVAVLGTYLFICSLNSSLYECKLYNRLIL